MTHVWARLHVTTLTPPSRCTETGTFQANSIHTRFATFGYTTILTQGPSVVTFAFSGFSITLTVAATVFARTCHQLASMSCKSFAAVALTIRAASTSIVTIFRTLPLLTVQSIESGKAETFLVFRGEEASK